MSLHDAYARFTPYELALPDAETVEALARDVEDEAEGRGVDLDDLNSFLTLGSVDAFVRRVAGGDVDPTALHSFGPLAFHLVRFQRAGRPIFLLSTHVARYLVEGAPEGPPTPPQEAGYLQLPQHLFWSRAAGDAPESVDGVFWASTRTGILHTLLVTGIRPDRPGLGVVALPPSPVADAPRWLDVVAREEAEDFATDLPGAELDALYGIETAGELLKLLARFFAYVASTPAAAEERAGTPTEADGPRPTALPFRRVTLHAP